MREYQALTPKAIAEVTGEWAEWARPSPSLGDGHQRQPGCSLAGGVDLGPQRPAVAGARCQVPGCGRSLKSGHHAGFYCQKNKICQYHRDVPSLWLDGHLARFCQLCRRFQCVSDFDGHRKNCRRVLDRHNSRRREKRKKNPSEKGSCLRAARQSSLMPSNGANAAAAPLSLAEPPPCVTGSPGLAQQAQQTHEGQPLHQEQSISAQSSGALLGSSPPPSPQDRPLLLPQHEHLLHQLQQQHVPQQLLHQHQQHWLGQEEVQPTHQQPGPVEGMLPATQQEREQEQCRAVVLPIRPTPLRPAPISPGRQLAPWPLMEGYAASQGQPGSWSHTSSPSQAVLDLSLSLRKGGGGGAGEYSPLVKPLGAHGSKLDAEVAGPFGEGRPSGIRQRHQFPCREQEAAELEEGGGVAALALGTRHHRAPQSAFSWWPQQGEQQQAEEEEEQGCSCNSRRIKPRLMGPLEWQDSLSRHQLWSLEQCRPHHDGCHLQELFSELAPPRHQPALESPTTPACPHRLGSRLTALPSPRWSASQHALRMPPVSPTGSPAPPCPDPPTPPFDLRACRDGTWTSTPRATLLGLQSHRNHPQKRDHTLVAGWDRRPPSMSAPAPEVRAAAGYLLNLIKRILLRRNGLPAGGSAGP